MNNVIKVNRSVYGYTATGMRLWSVVRELFSGRIIWSLQDDKGRVLRQGVCK